MSSAIMQQSPQVCTSGAALPAGIRALTGEEIMLVSGAFSFAELYGSAFSGAIAGGVGGLAVGGLAGVGAGALAGAVTGGVGYLAFEAWMYCFG
jgi:hypothetical protein